jgi:hypothetical protein
MRRVLVVPAVVVCLLAPAAAAHASARDVIRDCTDNGQIDSHHSAQDYNSALHNLPSDVDEYTDCRQIIAAAERRDAGGGGGGGGGGGSVSGGGLPGVGGTPPPAAGANLPKTPGEAGALAQAAKNGGNPVSVSGTPITPGGSGITSAAFRHSLPAPLIALLALLGLGGLAWALTVARARGLHLPVPVGRVLDRAFPRRA